MVHGSLPPHEQLLRRRVLPIETFASELQRGVHTALTRDARLRLYGSVVAPIHVPLDPGETEAQHERRFLIWLSRRQLTLADLKGNANDERSFRIWFAKIKTRMYAQRHGLAGAKRSRIQYEEEDEDEEEDDDDEEEEEEEDDESDGEETYVSQTTSVLLRTRVLSSVEYRREVERDALHKPTPRERLARYGTLNEPIPVPLFAGETEREYERKFVSFLATRGLSLARLARNPGKERSIRMNYARQRVGGHLKAHQIAALAKRAAATKSHRVTDENDAVRANATTPPAASTSSLTDATGGFPTSCTLQPPPPGSDDSATPKAYLACGCRKCLLRCTSRLVRQVTELQEDLAETTSTNSSNGRAGPVMDLTREGDTAVSMTASSIPPSPAATAPTATGRGADVAKMLQIMSLIKNRRQAASSSLSSRVASSSGGGDDPIERQLRNAYDEINERVIANERVLESEARALAEQASAFSDHRHHDHSQLQAASRTQDENQELGVYIEEEKDHRDAALAVLVVYTWRHTPQELQQRLEQASASSVAHVTRACHLKCTTLASELRALEAEAGELKQQLDAVLSGGASSGSSFGGEHEQDEELRRLMELQRVGEQLTRVETAMQQIHRARHRELTTLVHFDAHVRELTAELLREAS